MGRPRTAAGKLAPLLLVLSLLPAPGARAELRAGAASADITAPVGTPMFAYTARSMLANPTHLPEVAQVIADPDTNLYAKSFVPSRGIHTRVRARALVLQDGATKVALVQADLGGLPYALTQSVLQRISATGIDGDHLLLSATHTHSSTGPIWPLDNLGYGALGGDLFDPRIFELTAQGIAEAIIAADRQRVPARAGVGVVELRDATRNRESEVFALNKDLAQHPDKVNPKLTVLRVDAAAGGDPIGMWSNFASHGTSFGDGNANFSGDNPGVAAQLAQRATGAIDVWSNANEGDTSPDGDPHALAGEPDTYVKTDAAKAHLAGERQAAGIVRAWKEAGRHLSGNLALESRRTFFSFDGTEADGQKVGPVPVLGAGGIVADDGQCAPVADMSGPGQGNKMWAAGGPLLPTTFPLSLVRIGGLGILSSPSEVTKQMGTRMLEAVSARAAAKLDHLVLAGLTNAYASYTATPEEYDACTYEGSFTLFGRQQGARYRDVSLTLADALATGKPAPAGAAEPPNTSFGAESGPPPRRTPNAGTAVQQPKDTDRFGRAIFRWNGGDPSLEAARGQRFVTLERRGADGDWDTYATDDTFADTTERAAGDVWTETFQFDQCDPRGTYRFVVTGRADTGAGAAPYRLVSDPFTLGGLTLAPGTPQLGDGEVRLTAHYPDPGASLLALPRFVTTGEALLRVTDADGKARTVRAAPDPGTGTFAGKAPKDARSVELVTLTDGCGNGSA
jgi:neutral ceramidase